MMDKTLAGLIGAVAAVAMAPAAQAATELPRIDAVMQAASYADLLKPIPNASALLRASDEAVARRGDPTEGANASVQDVAYHPHHHHHHHHHRRYVRYHHHHHHHHAPGLAVIIR